MALAIRLGALFVWHDHLNEDRDAYVGIAKQLAAGNGFSDASGQRPTAFRPPLYPLFLSAVYRCGGGPITIGILQALLGTVTVWLVLQTAAQVTAKSTSNLAAILSGLFVAVDPLLLLYTTFVMTEVVMATLLALLFYYYVHIPGHGFRIDVESDRNAGDSSNPSQRRSPSRRQSVVLGLLFGACALCRPSIWPFGLLAITWWCVANFRSKNSRNWSHAVLVVVGVAVLIVPWTIRNAQQIGKPVFATTHGGYTLHLANNRVFYKDVVQKPWGTTWSRERLDEWNADSAAKMKAAQVSPGDEPAIDRWHRQQAVTFIRSNPVGFLRGCVLKFLRFWSPIPNTNTNTTVSSAGPSRSVVWAVGSFYVFVLIGLLLCVIRGRQNRWAIGFGLLLISFSIVHSVFWSNARMRAPLVPAIAVLSACGWCDFKNRMRRPASPRLPDRV